MQTEIDFLKNEVKELKEQQSLHHQLIFELKNHKQILSDNEEVNDKIFKITSNITIQKWYIPINIVIQDEYTIETVALFDIGLISILFKKELFQLNILKKQKKALDLQMDLNFK